MMAANAHAVLSSTNEMFQNLYEKKTLETDTPKYSKEGCEFVAAILTGMLESAAIIDKEHQAMDQMILSLDLENVCSLEVLLNQSKILEKKDHLKQLLNFLDASESRLEKMLSDLKWKILSDLDVDEEFHKGFSKGYDQAMEEKNYRLQEIYSLIRDVVWAYIKLLDFVFDRLSVAKNNHSDLKSVFKSKEDLNKLQFYLDAAVNASMIYEEKALASEQRRKEALNVLSFFTQLQQSIALTRIEEVYKEKIQPYIKACAEIDWRNIYTEAVLLNCETIAKNKKELEWICPIIDEMEKKWEKEIPDAMFQVLASLCQSNKEREILEEFIAIFIILEKELVSIRKKYTLEYLQLLNFFSVRYGSYKILTEGIQFAYGIESKLCKTLLNNIQQLLEKEEATVIQVRQLIQKLRDQIEYLVKSPSSEKNE
jgi:hypothetical protein